MDFSNLTFDELLDAIRSDSGYQTAQAKKEQKKQEQTAAVITEPAPTPAEEPSPVTESREKENISTDDIFISEPAPDYVPVADYYGEAIRFSDPAPDFAPIDNLFTTTDIDTDTETSEPVPVFAPVDEIFATTNIKTAEPVPALPAIDDIFTISDKNSDTESSKSDCVFATLDELFPTASTSSKAAEPVQLNDAQEPKTDDRKNPEPLSSLPNINNLFEIVEETPEEPAVWEAPSFAKSFYVPVALEDEPQDDIPDENSDFLQSLSPDSTKEQPEPFNLVAEPIEIVQTAEEEEETEPIPTKENYADLYGFSIDRNSKDLFDFEKETEKPQTNTATDKTRIIAPPAASYRPRTSEKTQVISKPASEVADGKTRPINYAPVFERPGIVTTSSAYDKTADLNAMPHILPADEFIGNEPKKFHRTGEIPKIDTQPKPPVVRHDAEDEQMVLPGFFDLEEVVRVSESEVEEELRRTRSRKVNSFKLEGADINEPFMNEDVSRELQKGNTDLKKRRFSRTKTRHRLSDQRVEFSRPSDGRTVHGFIKNKKLLALIGTVTGAISALALIITTAIPFIADKINLRSDGIPATYIISLVFLIVAAAAAMPSCVSGITCFFNGTGRPNVQTPVIIATVAALIQNILAITTYNETVYPLFSLAAVFLLCCCSLGNMLIYKRTMSNFAFLFKQGKEGLYSVRAIDNALDANRVSQNVVMGDAEIRYSGKLKFATRFISYSLSSNATDDLCAKLIPISLIASVVIGLIAGFIDKSFMGGVSIFCGALCMGSPVCALIAANLPLLIENKRMNADGAMITSYAAAYEYESTNAIALDASDLFPGENCNIHGMKTFNGLRVDDAVLTAASMLIASGGPTSSLFKNVIMEHSELLLNVEELKYEERLGLSGWIRGRKVLVGNRKLLENHNIEIPMSVDESKYARGDRQIIYLADAGKIAAFFVVSYGRNKKIAEYLRRIESNGINILVRTTDSNINEKFISKCFDIPLNSVKVVSNTAGEVLKNYSEHVKLREDAKLIHNGTATAFLHAVSSAAKLCATAGKISTLQTSCMAAGLLLTILVMVFSGPLSLTALSVCLCQALWMAIAAILPLFGRE